MKPPSAAALAATALALFGCDKKNTAECSEARMAANRVWLDYVNDLERRSAEGALGEPTRGGRLAELHRLAAQVNGAISRGDVAQAYDLEGKLIEEPDAAAVPLRLRASAALAAARAPCGAE